MEYVNKSSSLEQVEAEKVMLEEMEAILQIPLKANPKIYLSDNEYTYIQPDFYSEDAVIIGEIFAHIGKPKKAQDNKIANDILKMLLLEKVQNKTYRKIIVTCDEHEEKKLHGPSALAESIRQFGIEIIRIDLPEQIRNKIIDAQIRQKMVNY